MATILCYVHHFLGSILYKHDTACPSSGSNLNLFGTDFLITKLALLLQLPFPTQLLHLYLPCW